MKFGSAHKSAVSSFQRDESGQGMAEYIIIVIVVAIAVILGLRYFGGSVTGKFSNATSELKHNQRDGPAGEIPATGGAPAGGPEGPGREGGPSSGTAGRSAGDGGAPKKAPENSSSDSASLDGRVDELRTGVGDSGTGKPVEQIQISASGLIILAVVVVGLGFVIFMATMRDKEKRKERKNRKKVKLVSNDKGQAMVEFVLAAITFFFVILGVMQLAMALNAYSLVRYAAYNAARAAIVHGGDQEKMEEAARLSLVATFPSHGRADTPRGVTENYLGAKATDKIPALTFFNEPITKVELIRRPGADGVVTFDDPRDAPKGIITVKVTHLYELVIPLVNRIIFKVFMLIKQGPGYQGQTVNQLSAETDVERRSGDLRDKEFRIPLVGVYTMRMQSDLS